MITFKNQFNVNLDSSKHNSKHQTARWRIIMSEEKLKFINLEILGFKKISISQNRCVSPRWTDAACGENRKDAMT